MIDEKFPTARSLFTDILPAFISYCDPSEHDLDTSLEPLLAAVQTFRTNRLQHRKEHEFLTRHLHFTLSPANRDSGYLFQIRIIFISRLPTPYPPTNHYIYETEEIGQLWYHQTQIAPQPDPRRARSPMHSLQPSLLQYDLGPDESAIFVDQETQKVVAMVCRNAIGHEVQQIVEWVDSVVVQGAKLKQTARVSSNSFGVGFYFQKL